MKFKISKNITQYQAFKASEPFEQSDWESIGSYYNWLLMAEKLKDVSEVLFKEEERRYQAKIRGQIHSLSDVRSVYEQYFLFIGYCLENLFKGLIVKADNKILKNKRIDSKLLNHDLVKLAKQSGFEITSTEENHLKRWTNAILFSAKYPIPLDGGKIETEDEIDLYDAKSTFESLFERLTFRFLQATQ